MDSIYYRIYHNDESAGSDVGCLCTKCQNDMNAERVPYYYGYWEEMEEDAQSGYGYCWLCGSRQPLT